MGGYDQILRSDQRVTFAGEGEAPGGAVRGVLHQAVVTQTLVVHVALQLGAKQLVGGGLKNAAQACAPFNSLANTSHSIHAGTACVSSV